MIWFGQRRHGVALEEAAADLAAARERRNDAERLAKETESRWPAVFRMVSEARKIRKANHLVDDIMTIFRSH